MPLIQLLEVLIVVGVLLWLVNRFIPMQSSIKSILNGVVVIAVRQEENKEKTDHTPEEFDMRKNELHYNVDAAEFRTGFIEEPLDVRRARHISLNGDDLADKTP